MKIQLNRKMMAPFFLLLVLLSGCKEETVEPTKPHNLVLKADVLSDGSGIVHFTAKADNAVTYSFTFGLSTSEKTTASTDGTATFKYEQSGIYQAKVIAYSANHEAAVKTLKVTVTVQEKEETPETYYTRYNQYGTPFSKVPATKDVAMYEVNQRAYSVAGNLDGITARLDSIKALGINVIWLMPIHPIGKIKSTNSPYSVQNFKEVNPEFGTLESLRKMTTAAHSKGMAVVLDWVANHTAWDNPWLANKSWYTQVGGNIISPADTNWNDVADLNFENQTMRAAMIDALKYWVYEANIDGYRFDAADYVPFHFWKQALDSLQAIPNRNLVLLAEGERVDHFSAGFQMSYSWTFYAKLKEVYNGKPASELYTTHQNEYQSLPAGKHKLRFTTNHDESAWDATPITLFKSKQGALAASVLAIYMGGVPLIYGSQEVGVAEKVPFFTKSPINWGQNPDMFKAYQAIMEFYGQSTALKEGSLQDYSNTDVVCFTRKHGTEEVLVLVNVRPTANTFQLPAALQNTTWKDAFLNASTSLTSDISLAGFEYKVFKK